jgi:hypothetical protein
MLLHRPIADDRQRPRRSDAAVTLRAHGGCGRRLRRSSVMMKEHQFPPCAGQTGKVLDVKVINVEGLANHDSSESCAVAGNCRGEALTGGGVGPVLSRERHEPLPGAETLEVERRQHLAARNRECRWGPARSEARSMRPSTLCGNRESPRLAWADGARVRKGNLRDGGHRR